MTVGELRDLVSGVVRVRVTEVFPTYFLGICAARKITLRFLRKTEDALTCTVRFREKNAFLDAVRDSGARVEILSENGLPVLLGRYRSRPGIPLGALLFFCTVFCLASFVWGIEVTGMEDAESDAFLHYMADFGIRRGMPAADVDCGDAEILAEKYARDIRSVSVNLIGSRLYIQVKRRTLPPAIRQENTYADVVAQKDGRIVKADLFAGKLLVREGDDVLRGQILVSGLAESQDGTVRPVRAQARILAETDTAVRVSVPEKISVKTVTVRNRRVLPYLFLSPPTPEVRKEHTVRYEMITPLRIGGTALPVGFVSQCTVERRPTLFRPDEKQAFLLALCALSEEAEARTAGTEFLTKRESAVRDSRGYLEGKYTCLEDIGASYPMELLSDPPSVETQKNE